MKYRIFTTVNYPDVIKEDAKGFVCVEEQVGEYVGKMIQMWTGATSFQFVVVPVSEGDRK
jgi:hypothetical protein